MRLRLLSAVQPPSLQRLQGLRMEKTAAERWGRAEKQSTPCICELERALLSFLLVLRRASCQSHSFWEKVAEELFLSQFDKQTVRAKGCIATDEKTSIWRHWNKVEQSQSMIVKDKGFRQLCSLVTWIMLKNSFLLLLQWNRWVLTNMSFNCLFLLPLTELFFNNSDKFSLHFCTGIIKLWDYSPKVWDRVASITCVSKTFLCCSSRSIGSAVVCEQKRGNIGREKQHLLLQQMTEPKKGFCVKSYPFSPVLCSGLIKYGIFSC